jgi:hypothetical protein
MPLFFQNSKLKKMDNQLVQVPVTVEATPTISSFSDSISFDHAQRVAKMLASSNLIPKEYQGNVQNTMIALEMANRIGASPLMVMQNLYIVHGKPSWSSTFIIAAINSCKKFSPLRFEITGEGDGRGCTAWAYDLSNNDKLEGPKVTMEMAKKEGWVSRSGSKWQTMPDLMIRYRAAAFFGRLYAPEIMMGMHTSEEVHDMEPQQQTTQAFIQNKENERVTNFIQQAETVEQLNEVKDVELNDVQLDLFNKKMDVLNGK